MVLSSSVLFCFASFTSLRCVHWLVKMEEDTMAELCCRENHGHKNWRGMLGREWSVSGALSVLWCCVVEEQSGKSCWRVDCYILMWRGEERISLFKE